MKYFKVLIFGFLLSCSSDSDEPVPLDCSTQGPRLNLLAQDVTCGTVDANGTIEMQLTGGAATASFTILPDTGVLEGNIFKQLPEGDYTVRAVDANGCSDEASIVISRESKGISFEQDVKPIIASNCAISGCHNGDNDGSYGQKRDWRIFANVQNNATNIKNRINRDPGQVGFMPRVGSISAEEIAIISCWVDEGALQN